MLEKPNLPDHLIAACLRDAYALESARLDFLALGADMNTAVYRTGTSAESYFVKLRKGDFDETGVALSHWLYQQGMHTVIPPLETVTGALWAELDAYRLIVSPFVEGKDGYEVPLSARQWRQFGKAMRNLHTNHPRTELANCIPRETFSPHWRDQAESFLAQAETDQWEDPVATRLAAFMRAHRETILRLIARTRALCQAVQARVPGFVLCHGDIHPGNLHLSADDALYIVDWDNPIFAPPERDLAMIGGTSTWTDPTGIDLFYHAYDRSPDPDALAYYRCERAVTDVTEFCKQLFWSDQGGEDRELAYHYFTSSFEPGQTVELALTSPGEG
jgi:spectinomycin phosphotransferase